MAALTAGPHGVALACAEFRFAVRAGRCAAMGLRTGTPKAWRSFSIDAEEFAMTDENRGYMLDTNVFNAVLKEQLSIENFKGIPLFATHIQADELRATRTRAIADQLLLVFQVIAPNNTPTRSAVWDVSAWGEACWSDDDGLFEKMLSRLQVLDKAAKKRSSPRNQRCDILIAETAVKDNLTLVTDDQNLRCVAEEFGGEAMTLANFIRGPA